MKDRAAKPEGSDQTDCPFAPGEVIAESGLYEICHYDEPRTPVILMVNGFFPSCRTCGDKVRYKLVRAVPHISEDPDFNEFVSASDELRREAANQNHIIPLQLGCAHGFRFWQDPAQTGGDGSQVGDL